MFGSLVKTTIKLHWLPATLLALFMFLSGKIYRGNGSLDLGFYKTECSCFFDILSKDKLIEYHILIGSIFWYYMLYLFFCKIMVIVGVVGRPIFKNAFIELSIKNHFIFYFLAISAQYFTKGAGGEWFRSITGLDKSLTNQIHFNVPIGIVIYAIVLSIEKFLLAPRPSKKEKKE